MSNIPITPRRCMNLTDKFVPIADNDVCCTQIAWNRVFERGHPGLVPGPCGRIVGSFMLAACNSETTQFELAANLRFGSQRSGDSTKHRELVGAHCSCAPG